MNFTEKIRKDMLRATPEERDCRLALLAAFLDTGGQVLSRGAESAFSFTTASEEVAQYILTLVDGLFGVCMTVTEAARDPKHGRNKLSFACSGGSTGAMVEEIDIYRAASLNGDGIGEQRMRAYLKGAFLGSGSCTVPHDGGKTGYHLEFIFPDNARAEGFCELLDELQIIGGIVLRDEKYVVYCKNRETISDFLAVVGANGALRQLDEISAARAESNRENRVSNCYAGNADKAAIASANQILALRKLQQSGVLALLPEPLQETAAARMRYPTYSLSELAETLGVTKSCFNHRLRKLIDICKKELP